MAQRASSYCLPPTARSVGLMQRLTRFPTRICSLRCTSGARHSTRLRSKGSPRPRSMSFWNSKLARALTAQRYPNVAEVMNYIRAMNFGLERVKALPLSLRLIREIHEKLLVRVRGASREPGEFRRTQNWIGPPGCTLSEAIYVPPPPTDVPRLMGELESHLHAQPVLPPLVTCALVHAQFETIHPFLDGRTFQHLLAFALTPRAGWLVLTCRPFEPCWATRSIL